MERKQVSHSPTGTARQHSLWQLALLSAALRAPRGRHILPRAWGVGLMSSELTCPGAGPSREGRHCS